MQWAAYRFASHRNGMSIANGIGAPHLRAQMNHARYEFEVGLDLDGLPDLPSDLSWHLGLSAVIEETSGRKSYWALKHPSGDADFHHSDCFALELPAA
jgi:hypothetical protein